MITEKTSNLASLALKEITLYPTNLSSIRKAFVKEKPHALTNVFCTLSDGQRITETDVVFGYVGAANAISNRAAELIIANPSTASIIKKRDDIANRIQIKPIDVDLAEGNIKDHQAKLQLVNQQIVQSMLDISSGANPDGLDIRACNFAIMLLEVEERKQTLRESILANKTTIQAHINAFHQARAQARQGQTVKDFDAITQQEYEKVWLNFLESQLQRTGHIPTVRLINDVDQNLTPHEDSILKPGNAIGQLINHLDKSFKSNFRLRLPLTDFSCDDPANPHRHLSQQLLKQAGKITHPVFADAVNAAELAHKTHSGFTILTSNFEPYGTGVAPNLKHPQELIIEGLRQDSIMAQEKPIRLVEEILSHPDDVILFSDDRDRRTCEAILSGSVIEGFPFPLPLEDLIMFASRVAGEKETADYRLAATLKEKDVAFAANHKEGNNGYQGVVGLMTIYQQWREKRLSEGWPETDIEAKAQTYIQKMVASAKDASQTYINQLEIERQKLLEFIDPEVMKGIKSRHDGSTLELINKVLTHFEENDTVHHKQLSLIKRQLEALTQNLHGLGINLLLKANEIYEKNASGLPENSKKRNVIATKAYSQARIEQLNQQSQESINPLTTPPPDLVQLHLIGHDLIADINLGELNSTALQSIFEQPLINFAFSNTAARYVLVRFTDGANPQGIPNEYSLAIERPEEAQHKLAKINGKVILDGRGQIIFPDLAKTHLDQVNLITKTLHEYIRIALVYYRNPFEQGGGLEKVLREHGKSLKKLGFTVRFIGGNPPNENYGAELINQFEHKVIQGAHERDADVVAMANQLYQGEIPPNYQSHVRMLMEQLIDAFADVDHAIIHNPLFPRNPAFTEAVMSLFTSGKLNIKSLIGWVHDIGLDVETPNYHDMQGITPWTWVGKRQPGVQYVAVSEPVAKKLDQQPLYDPDDKISSTPSSFITHGSDFDAMQPNNELTRFLKTKINWNKTNQVWITSGRIAHRKGTLEAIAATSCLKTATLIITGAPHFTQKGNERVIDDQYYDVTRTVVRQLGIEDRIIFLFDYFGEVPDGVYEQFIGQLYKGFDGVLSLPFAEGFGIDALNAITENSNLIVSDDPALKSNIGDSANYIPIGSHPLIPATTMAAVLANDRGYKLRHESRTIRTWDAKVKQMLPFLGTMFNIENLELPEV